jgi:hypothetical protein
MDKKSMILKSFNKQFFDFLEDVQRIVENNEDITTSYLYFDTIKKANPTLLLKIWHQHIYMIYKEQIHLGDLTFFLDKDYSQDLSKLKNNTEIMKIIDNSLRNPMRNMTDINKTHCMKYIQLLCKLSDAYISL